jgi:hypothetical protein
MRKLIGIVLLFSALSLPHANASREDCNNVFKQKMQEYKALQRERADAYQQGVSIEQSFDTRFSFVKVNGKLMSRAHAAALPKYDEARRIFGVAQALLRAAKEERDACYRRNGSASGPSTNIELLHSLIDGAKPIFKRATQYGGSGRMLAQNQFQWAMDEINKVQTKVFKASGVATDAVRNFEGTTDQSSAQLAASPDPSVGDSATFDPTALSKLTFDRRFLGRWDAGFGSVFAEADGTVFTDHFGQYVTFYETVAVEVNSPAYPSQTVYWGTYEGNSFYVECTPDTNIKDSWVLFFRPYHIDGMSSDNKAWAGHIAQNFGLGDNVPCSAEGAAHAMVQASENSRPSAGIGVRMVKNSRRCCD